ncbi:MAG: helix-turn-helix transcriptional regulator, partial [Myxococcales bacterium]|nr:helix-turn-helix transcriptional regulator [Myxococcales bacterium]
LLPPVLRVTRPSPTLKATLTLVEAELDGYRPGVSAMLTRLTDLVFIHVLRAHVASLPAHAEGLLGALGDAQVADAMTLIHRRPDEAWTVGALAEAVGLSRSAFAERFNRLVGTPPLQYLTRWRVHVALDRLADPRQSTAQVAEAVGYGSEDAFVRVFRRVMGQTPAAWRRGWQAAGIEA